MVLISNNQQFYPGYDTGGLKWSQFYQLIYT